MADNALKQRIIKIERRINQNLSVCDQQLAQLDAALDQMREAYDQALALYQSSLVLPGDVALPVSPRRQPSRVEITRLEDRRKIWADVQAMLRSVLAEPAQGIRYPAASRQRVLTV